MKEIKLYNVIFPIWFLLFFPPVIIFTLVGNFVIDSLVLLACFFAFKLSAGQFKLKIFYLKNIFKVWLFGFLADIIGAVLLFTVTIAVGSFGVPQTIVSAINFNPFKSLGAVLIIISAMLISGFFIFLFNYRFTFNKSVEDKHLRFKLALTLAIITIPWTFLLPTQWFYHGL